MFILSRWYGSGFEFVIYTYISKLPQTPTLISFECDSCCVKCLAYLDDEERGPRLRTVWSSFVSVLDESALVTKYKNKKASSGLLSCNTWWYKEI